MPEERQCEGPSDPHCSLKQYVPVPIEGDYVVRRGKVLKVENVNAIVTNLGVDGSLGFNLTGWIKIDE